MNNCGSQSPSCPQWFLPPGVSVLVQSLLTVNRADLYISRILCKWRFMTSKARSIEDVSVPALFCLKSLYLGEVSHCHEDTLIALQRGPLSKELNLLPIASTYLPIWAILQLNPPAPVKVSDEWYSGQHFDSSFMWNPEPGPPS